MVRRIRSCQGKGANCEVVNHPGKDHSVNWVEQVPISQAKQAFGGKISCLNETRLADLVREGLKLEPSATREFHFGAQQQALVRLDDFNTPEVNCIPDANGLRIPPAST